MKVSGEGLYQCFSGIQSEHPIFIPKEPAIAAKLVEEAHILIIHWAVTITTAKINQSDGPQVYDI